MHDGKKWLGILIIFLCTFGVGSLSITIPGVYFDAVYPDYLAAIMAFPGTENFAQITQHMGFPLLGNLYHGTLTIVMQFIVLKLIGRASVYTLRFVNLFYFAIAGSIVFLFTHKVSKKYLISLIGSIITVTGTAVLSMPRTQYYIMLPGVIFFLLSIYFLFCNYYDRKESSEKLLILAGVMQGLAFYDYFSYLLMAPVSLVIIWQKEKKAGKLIGLFCYCLGIFAGSIFYFWGYYDSILVNFLGVNNVSKLLLILGCTCMSLIIGIPIYVMIKKSFTFKKKVVKGYSLAAVLGMVLCGCLVIILANIWSEKMESVFHLSGLIKSRNTGIQWLLYWKMTYQLISGISANGVMFGKAGSDCKWLVTGGGAVVVVVTGALLFLKKSEKGKEEKELLLYIYGYLLGFYLCSLPIIRGMQPQHFVVNYFLFYLLIITSCCYLYSLFADQKLVYMILLFGMLEVGINIVGNMHFLDELKRTEGVGGSMSST